MKKFLTTLAFIALGAAMSAVVSAQGRYEVKGIVVDQQGPVVGASVIEKSTTNGTMTGLDGDYSIKVTSPDAVVEISCVGYTTVSFKASEVPATLTLTEDTALLDEVVVIGYGTVKKSDMTGSVSTVKADQLNKGVVASPGDMLRGKSAGVVVTTGDGAPGAAPTIRIRGGSSLKANNNPLIIVDGLPISEVGISGVSDGLASVNPADIESFTVLKDASATAIYGSRASNGVIIITTKTGSKTATTCPHVSADFKASLSQNSKYLKVMTGDEMRDVIAKYKGTDSDAYRALGKANTDWQKEIFRLAQTYDANVGLDGNVKLGSAGYMPYRVSGGFMSQEGTLKNTDMKRGTATITLNPKLFDEHLSINLNGKYMHMDNGFGDSGAVGAAIEYDPTQPVYFKDYGESKHPFAMADPIDGYRVWASQDGSAINTQSSQNPLARIMQRTNTSKANRFIGNAQIDYKIHGLEDLRLNLNMGMDYSKSNGVVATPAGCEQTVHSQNEAGSGLDEKYNQVKKDQTLEAYLDYSHTFGGKHFLDVMAGYSWQHFYNETYDIKKKATTGEVLGEFPFKTEYFLVSFFGRANYSFDNRFLLTATVRYDGTSRFSNNKWGLFPSVAASWNLKNENWLKNSDAVSALKLRLSWGRTGQQDLQSGDYPTLAKYRTNGSDVSMLFGGQQVIPITPLGYNADLKWETTTTYNVGLDWGFAKGRIYGSIDAYRRDTYDLLNYTPVAAGANLTNYLDANIGNLTNIGVELDLNAVAIETKDASWTIGVNAAWNKNTITKLTANDGAEGYTGVATGGISGGTGNNIQRHMVGHPTSTFFVYEQIYDEAGKPIMGAYVDRNNDGQINEADLYYYKKPAPDVTIGFNTQFTYKTWTLALNGHGAFGNYVYNNNASRLSLLSDLWTNNFIANRIAGAYDLGFTEAQYFSDYFIQNASYFKIDNITLSKLFNIGQKMGLSVFATVQNVATITKYSGIDPEIYSGIDNQMYPRPRNYILGLKFNF